MEDAINRPEVLGALDDLRRLDEGAPCTACGAAPDDWTMPSMKALQNMRGAIPEGLICRHCGKACGSMTTPGYFACKDCVTKGAPLSVNTDDPHWTDESLLFCPKCGAPAEWDKQCSWCGTITLRGLTRKREEEMSVELDEQNKAGRVPTWCSSCGAVPLGRTYGCLACRQYTSAQDQEQFEQSVRAIVDKVLVERREEAGRGPWLAVSDFVPRRAVEVLVTDGDEVTLGIYDSTKSYGHGGWDCDESDSEKFNVTHWMRIPALPE